MACQHEKACMKSLIFSVCLFVLSVAFTSCQKGETTNTNLAATSIVGSWELRTMQGGMLPARELAPGNGTILHFTDTHYTKYENNTAVQTGTYAIIEDSTVSKTVGLVMPPGKSSHRIILKNDANMRSTFIDIEGDKLSLVWGYFPLDYGVFQQYEKIQADQ